MHLDFLGKTSNLFLNINNNITNNKAVDNSQIKLRSDTTLFNQIF